MKKDLTFHHEEFKVITDECKNFISKFLKKDPAERIKLEDAVKDVWFEHEAPKVEINLSQHKDVVEKINAYKKTNLFTKAIKLCMSKIYENSNFESLKAKFWEYDANKNGILERDEFTQVMRCFDFSDAEIDMMMTALDLNNDGQIEFSEFISGCSSFDRANM